MKMRPQTGGKDEKPIRLQVVIAQAGVCSRRKAEELISAGVVRVNGLVVTELGRKVDRARDHISVEGKPLGRKEEPAVYLFHKPRGVVTTLNDPRGRPCIGDYLKNCSERLFPVGRLDFDVSGLLLLTNNGALAQKLLHPRYGTERVYWARLRGEPKPDELERLTKGVELADGPGKAARVVQLKPSKRVQELIGSERGQALVEIAVAEGRKHFVKRLFEALGYPVERLSRVGFGPHLLGMLKPGEMLQIGEIRPTRPRRPGSGARGRRTAFPAELGGGGRREAFSEGRC